MHTWRWAAPEPGSAWSTDQTEEPESERCPGFLLLSPCIPCLSTAHPAVRADTGTGAEGHGRYSLRGVGEGSRGRKQNTRGEMVRLLSKSNVPLLQVTS